VPVEKGCVAKKLRGIGRPWKPRCSPAFRERLQTIQLWTSPVERLCAPSCESW